MNPSSNIHDNINKLLVETGTRLLINDIDTISNTLGTHSLSQKLINTIISFEVYTNKLAPENPIMPKDSSHVIYFLTGIYLAKYPKVAAVIAEEALNHKEAEVAQVIVEILNNVHTHLTTNPNYQSTLNNSEDNS